eukprot:8161159-Ditylum_brightwellii.AAC.1
MLATGKSTIKAINIMQYLISRLHHTNEKVGVKFDKSAIISLTKAKEHKFLCDMLLRARTCISGMKNHINMHKPQTLIAADALFVLPRT